MNGQYCINDPASMSTLESCTKGLHVGDTMSAQRVVLGFTVGCTIRESVLCFFGSGIAWPFMLGILASAYRMRLNPVTTGLELLLYFFGSIVLHSAACTWNDVCDKELDAKVERTKHRPLAAGTMTVKAALIFLVPQLAVLLGLLSFTNMRTMKIAILGHLIWHPIYPFMKRITYWPQAWLGCLCTWNFVIGWATNTAEYDMKVLVTLFFGGWCWSMHSDSIYGMQDKEDDAKVGVKSTALLFGTSARPILSAFCVGFVSSLALYGVFNHHGPAYFLIAVLGTAIHLIWQVATLDMDNPRNCFARFDANGRHVGLILGSGMLVDYALMLRA